MEFKKTLLIVTMALLSGALMHAMSPAEKREKQARFNTMIQERAIAKANQTERDAWIAEFSPIFSALQSAGALGPAEITMAQQKIEEFKSGAGSATAIVESLYKAAYEPAKNEFNALVDKLKDGGTQWGPFVAGAANPANAIAFETFVDQMLTLYKNQWAFVDQHPTLEPAEKTTEQEKLTKMRNFVLARATEYSFELLAAATDAIDAIDLKVDDALKPDNKLAIYKAFETAMNLLRRVRYESGIYKSDGDFLDVIPNANVDVYNKGGVFGADTFDFAGQRTALADRLKEVAWQTFVNKIFELQLIVTDDTGMAIVTAGGKTKAELYGTNDADEIRAIDIDLAYQVSHSLLDRLGIMRSMFGFTDGTNLPAPNPAGGAGADQDVAQTVKNFATEFETRAKDVLAAAAPAPGMVDLKAEVTDFDGQLKDEFDPAKAGQLWAQFQADKVANTIGFPYFSGWVDLLNQFNGKLVGPDQVDLTALGDTLTQRHFEYATQVLELANAKLQAADAAFAIAGDIDQGKIDNLRTAMQEAGIIIIRVLQQTDLLAAHADPNAPALKAKIGDVLDQFWAIADTKIRVAVLGQPVFGAAALGDVAKLELQIVALASVINDQMRAFQDLFVGYIDVAKDPGALQGQLRAYAEGLIAPAAPVDPNLTALQDGGSMVSFKNTVTAIKELQIWADFADKMSAGTPPIQKNGPQAKAILTAARNLHDVDVKNAYNAYLAGTKSDILENTLYDMLGNAILIYNDVKSRVEPRDPDIADPGAGNNIP